MSGGITPCDGPVELAGLTTFCVGGPAGCFVEATTQDDLTDAVRAADASSEPVFVLSGGSNVLVGDAGFPGTVVHVATQGWGVDETTDDEVSIWAAAGEVTDALVAACVEERWAGLEALSGIPGLIGAAPVQNIGAYGAEIAQAVAGVLAWDRQTGQERYFSADECGFAYRDSVFKQSRPPSQATSRYVVLRVQLRLQRSPLGRLVAYAELAQLLGAKLGAQVPLAEMRAAVLELRRGKSMVVQADDPDSHSAGSFFTNPILTSQDAARLPQDAPRYPQPGGYVKTSAAWLIEQAGFPKGYGTGPARLSSKHTLALTNQGGATAADIVALARTVQAGVQAHFGVTLEPEPVLVGVDL